MAVRQISGVCLNGQLLSGGFVWLFGEPLRSVGDVLADTMVMYDPTEFWRNAGALVMAAYTVQPRRLSH